jgi:hypothetical protein
MFKVKIFLLTIALGATISTSGMVYAQSVSVGDPISTFINGMSFKQAYLYIPKDAKSKNLTAFEILRVNHIDSIGKWNLLTEGLCLDGGLDYDAISKQTIDGGAVLVGKHINPLLDSLNVAYPWKGKWDATLYLGGDSFSKDGGKWDNKFAIGAAYVQVDIKI